MLFTAVNVLDLKDHFKKGSIYAGKPASWKRPQLLEQLQICVTSPVNTKLLCSATIAVAVGYKALA